MSFRQVLYGGLLSKFEYIASTLSKIRLRFSVRSMNGLRQPSSGAVGDSKITGSASTAREIRSGRSQASEPIAVAPAEWPTADDARPAHRGNKPLEVAHGRVPAVVAVGRRRTVAVAALIVAVYVTDRAQPLCERSIDAPEKSGRVQDHDRRAAAAPVQRMQPDAIDVHEARRWFLEVRVEVAWFVFFHVSRLRALALTTDSAVGFVLDRRRLLIDSLCFRRADIFERNRLEQIGAHGAQLRDHAVDARIAVARA